jgi:hypothetical protein
VELPGDDMEMSKLIIVYIIQGGTVAILIVHSLVIIKILNTCVIVCKTKRVT